MIYINDFELTRELIISKGKGKRTKRLEELLIILADNVIVKFTKTIYDQDILYDIKYHALLHILTKWRTFNHLKYSSSLPYMTELYKRSIMEGININVYQCYYSEGKKLMVRFTDNLRQE